MKKEERKNRSKT